MSEFKRKYQIDTEENQQFLRKMRDDLLSFGHRFPSPGGASYYLGDDGIPWMERPRETWITCRMTHVYSIGTFLGHEGSAELVDAGLKGIRGELHDTEHGGWYAGITADGEILPNKQCYAHAFVILAASSAYLAGREGAKELLEEALQLYDERFWNEEEGLACDTWNTEFTVLDDYRGLNANMHTVEAFLAAADALKDDRYRVRAGRIIAHVIIWAQNNSWRIPEHFTKEWIPDLECNKEKPDDPFKPYGATPGHGLEWGRLITQWAVSTYKDSAECKAYIEAAQKLYDRAVADAWNCDGAPGIVYTTDWNGNPVVHDRMHWTLAEAINTSAVLYRVTGNPQYADDYAEYMKYLDATVLDHVNGSWFHQLDRNNQLMGTVWPGKSDIYHALQAVLIPYSAVDVSIAAAVKEQYSGGGTLDAVALGEILIDFTPCGRSETGQQLFEQNPGGAPANVLAVLSKFGRKTAFIGKVGKDMHGTFLKKVLEENHISSEGLVEGEDAFTTLAFVALSDTGERSFSFARKPGADTCLTQKEVKEELIRNSKIFHIGSLSLTAEPIRETTFKALEIAKEAGCIISYDPNYRAPLWGNREEAVAGMRSVVPYVDIMKVSDEETVLLTDIAEPEGAAKKLIEQGVSLVAVTLGSEGALVCNKEGAMLVPGYKAQMIDTTGAGDSFWGGFLHKLLESGKKPCEITLKEAADFAKFGNAVASLCVEKRGAIPAIPTLNEVTERIEV